MAAKTDPRRVVVLLLLLVVLAAVFVIRALPALRGEGTTASVAQVPDVPAFKVPSFALPGGRAARAPSEPARNLFTYGPPPTPTPDRRPTATPAPTLPPRPVPTRTPSGILLADGRRLPDPPRFTMSYLGWLGPDRLPIAVFRDGEEVVTVSKGEQIKSRFIVRAVGPTTVTIGYTGYPDEVTTQVPLSR